MLCGLFQPVILPLKAIAINLLSLGASFGALVFILDILLPVVLFCILFGLSMDYEVSLLTRIKEAYDRSRWGNGMGGFPSFCASTESR